MKTHLFRCKHKTVALFWASVFFLSFLGILGCQKKAEAPPEKPAPTSRLTVFALRHIRDSGFETAVLQDFAETHNCALNLIVFDTLPQLLDSLRVDDDVANADVVLGLDSAFALADSLLIPFEALPRISLAEINYEIPKDPGQRLIPYATANLAFIYDSKRFPEPPRSFGELQDSRFHQQLALYDPAFSGLGRSSIFWSLALFGESGYEQFWQSLRKNVCQICLDHDEALSELRQGKCGLILGYGSTPAWIADFFPTESHIRASQPQEGSFCHTEYGALCTGSQNREMGIKLLEHLITPQAQQHVMFKLGMMPTNGRTPVSGNFARLPWVTYCLNSRLDKQEILPQLELWLRIWQDQIKSLPGL
ncbi:MAG: thiamine ABC transporter substrate-binding protein [Candidatus Cloacimonetes bacterium]|nr:thiamine ABC transporter substrate-binding protein [Candidatus Cloacimonadota bacterium]MDX9950377.1 thiamine ABC transporter substrate-binding protein [Candidatus Syntrophosphaera sp.]NLN85458.1 thiamine ABC transporter substrate-binding protein [Candidatus Cloacimonadota bacterium]